MPSTLAGNSELEDERRRLLSLLHFPSPLFRLNADVVQIFAMFGGVG